VFLFLRRGGQDVDLLQVGRFQYEVGARNFAVDKLLSCIGAGGIRPERFILKRVTGLQLGKLPLSSAGLYIPRRPSVIGLTFSIGNPAQSFC